jgi:xylulokinase
VLLDKIIGLDIGTTNIKGELYDVEGRLIDSLSYPYNSYFRDKNRVEQNASDWEQISINILNHLAEKYNNIISVGLSTQGGTCVPVDKNFEPLRQAITWLDSRAIEQKKALLKIFSEEEIYRITGWKLQSALPLLQINWIKDNEPENFKNAHRLMFVGDYLQQKFCNKSIVDYSNASITMLFDILKKTWSIKLLNALNLKREKLSKTGPSNSIIGYFNNKKLITSLKDVVFTNSGHDQYCVALSSNINKGNRLLLSTGTSWVTFKNTIKPFFNNYYYSPGVHIIPNKYGLISAMPTGGSAFNWFLNTFFSSNKESKLFLKNVEEQFEKVINYKNKCIFIPLFNGIFGPQWSNNISGCLENISLNLDKVNIYKSILEGITFQLKWIIETLNEIGIRFDTIKIIGGASESKIQCQIIADILDTEVVRPKDKKLNYACRGAAILSGMTTKIYKNYDHAMSFFLEEEETIKPISKNRAYYDAKYMEYIKTIKNKLINTLEA